MSDVPVESSENSEFKWPPKEEMDDLLRRASAQIRWLKAWGHLRMRAPTFSEDQALELARDIAGTMGREVRDVVDLARLNARGVRAPRIYGLDLSDCWIAYLDSAMVGLGPSHIVVIAKQDGAVRYDGSAYDEG